MCTARTGELPLGRWLGLGSLLAVEVLLLTVLYDPLSVARDGSWSSFVLRHLRDLPRVSVVIGVVLVGIGGHWLKSQGAWLSLEEVRPRRAGSFRVCHLVAFAGLTALSAWVFDKSAPTGVMGAGILLAWGLAAMATFLFWTKSVLPLSVWLRMVRHGASVLVASALVAVAGCQMGLVTQTLWQPLCRSTFWVVEHLLGLFFSDVVSDPAKFNLGTSTFMVNIAPRCSGFEGIGLIWVLLLGSFWIFRDRFRFPAALLLLPIGTALIWLSNAARIAGLVAIGTLVSPEVAVGGFHSYSGWLAFNLIGLGLLAASLRSDYFVVGTTETGAETTSQTPTAAYLVPLMAIVAAIMVTGALSEGFDRLYPLRVFAAAAALYCFRNAYDELRPSWSWDGLAIGLAVFALWMALEPSAAQTTAAMRPWAALSPGWAVPWLIARVLGSVVFVPVAEELAFRGYLMRRLVAADFKTVSPGALTVTAVAISSLAFGALHGRWLAGTLAEALYALAFYRQRGKLGDAVLAHATTNALIAVYVASD